jgi:hypothetical protein
MISSITATAYALIATQIRRRLAGSASESQLQYTSMSTPQPQPPLRPGDRVRYIYDCDHIEIVESCEQTAEAVPHWRVVTTWDGHRRIADAKEFVIAGT